MPITDCQKYFSPEGMPSELLPTTLRQSSTQPIAPPLVADGSIELSNASFAKSAPGFAASAWIWLARVSGSSAETNSMTCHPNADLTGGSSSPGVRPGA